MFESISISGAARIFQCPKCQETIDTSVKFCRFCGTPVDAGAAEEAAAVMAKVNQACSDASYLRIMAVSILVFATLSLAPIVGHLGYWGLLFLLFAVPVMLVRWWIKFGKIQSIDPDFRRARQTIVVISIPGVILPFIGLFLLYGMLAALGH
ncbi:MAG TPA: zinc ribbon domain-containing protein [Terracidiphilus sp.]|nr:zinc ribbon domain-containing protein [Terracidiphilus sp.]